MTTSWQQFKNWVSKEEGVLTADFTAAETILVNYFTPLFKQIVAEAETLGKGDFQAGLQVLTDAVTSAVGAGTAAIAAGQNPVSAAESQFITTTVTEGVTAVSNAEAGLIKAGVAIAQQVGTEVPGAISAVETAVAATPTT